MWFSDEKETRERPYHGLITTSGCKYIQQEEIWRNQNRQKWENPRNNECLDCLAHSNKELSLHATNRGASCAENVEQNCCFTNHQQSFSFEPFLRDWSFLFCLLLFYPYRNTDEGRSRKFGTSIGSSPFDKGFGSRWRLGWNFVSCPLQQLVHFVLPFHRRLRRLHPL
jgi:hypothetical protein